MSDRIMDLRPDRNLLDPDFTGYKLSLSPIPVHEEILDERVEIVLPGSDQFSYAHTRLFSLHNHLHQNPHTPGLIYVIADTWGIFELTIGSLNRVQTMVKVVDIPLTRDRKSGDYHPSISFASANRAVINDGAGTYHVAAVKKEKWIIIFSDNLIRQPTMISDARQFENQLYILNRSVLEPKFDTLLELVVLDEHWHTIETKKLQVPGNIDFISILSQVTLLIISQLPPKNVTDPTKTEEEPVYKWSQTGQDVIICVEATQTTKSEITVQVVEAFIKIEVKGKEIVNGELSHAVRDTSWTLESGKLEVVLKKVEESVSWQEVVKGDSRGVQVQTYREDPQEASFNTDELEEVDAASPAALFQFRVDTGAIIKQVDLTYSQFLFSTTLNPSRPRAVCLKSPIDGCVWEFEESLDFKLQPKHVGTFSAFGYVQASKTQKKFISAPPDLSYVVISDAFKHMYIFHQPSPVDGALRNRSSGVRVKAVAKQFLLNLETNDEILGLQTTNSHILVLTKTKFFLVVIHE